MSNDCRFCRIVQKDLDSHIIFEDKSSIAFLDHRPLFPGHVLLAPKDHCETLVDLPTDIISPLFLNAKLLGQAVMNGLGSEGFFVAINNRVSQSVPHLHIHIVPRRKNDGLKGFFWPRHPYKDEKHILEVQQILRSEMYKLKTNSNHTLN